MLTMNLQIKYRNKYQNKYKYSKLNKQIKYTILFAFALFYLIWIWLAYILEKQSSQKLPEFPGLF